MTMPTNTEVTRRALSGFSKKLGLSVLILSTIIFIWLMSGLYIGRPLEWSLQIRTLNLTYIRDFFHPVQNITTENVSMKPYLPNAVSVKLTENNGSVKAVNTQVGTVGQANQTERLFIYYCEHFCGGWGDRVKGIVTAYLIANLTSRRLGIMIPQMPCNLTSYLTPNEVNWDFPLRAEDRAGALTYSAMSTRFGTTLDRIDLEAKFPHRVVLFKTVGYIVSVKKNKRYWNQTQWLQNLRRDQIFSHIYNRLFRLAPDVQTKFDRVLRKARPELGGKLVCAHLRMANSGNITFLDSERRHTFAHGDTVFRFLLQFDDVHRRDVSTEHFTFSWEGNNTVSDSFSDSSKSRSLSKDTKSSSFSNTTLQGYSHTDNHPRSASFERGGSRGSTNVVSFPKANWTSIRVPSSTEINAIDDVIPNDASGVKSSRVRFFVTSDSAEYLHRAKRLFGDRLITPEGNFVHVDKARSGQAVCDGFTKVLLDQELLVHCDVLVVSMSGLGHQAAFRRGKDGGLFCILMNGTLVKCRADQLIDLFYPGRGL